MFDNYKDILTVKELCTALNIGKNTAYTMLERGEIKSIKIGKVYRIPKIALINYVKNIYNNT